ncbi:MAG: hypothetical protein WDZ59_12420 [Pirellulales bacterium]
MRKATRQTFQRRNERCTLSIDAATGWRSQTWKNIRVLQDNPHGWYCYTAMTFVDDLVLLAYCAGDRRENNGLAMTRVTQIPVEWLYRDTDRLDRSE